MAAVTSAAPGVLVAALSRQVPAQLRAQRWPRVLGGVRHAWQAPCVDCYALLGVPPSATSPQIKCAYLARAKMAHPDVMGGSAGHETNAVDMVQLNLCYEALTKRRTEYDASRAAGNVGRGQDPRAAAYGGGGSAPWWRHHDTSEDEFADFGVEWEELWSRHVRGHASWGGGARGRQERAGAAFRDDGVGGSGRAWRQWAEAWQDDEDEFFYRTTRRGRSKAQRARAARYERGNDSDAESSSEDERPRKSRKRSRADRAMVNAPSGLWIAKPDGQAILPSSWQGLLGEYKRMDDKVNDRPAYVNCGGRRSHFLFWSREFGDWKLAAHLDDDGVCGAFFEDARGKSPPWMNPNRRWRLWDPSQRRFVPRRLRIERIDGEEESDAPGAKPSQSMQDCGEAEEPVPWSRPHWSKWSTKDLMRWCEAREINTSACFDREALLDLVIAYVQADPAGQRRGPRPRQQKQQRANHRRQRPLNSSSDDSDDDDAPPHHRRSDKSGPGFGRHGSEGRGGASSNASEDKVQLASRMKTDGSYTRPPVLDRRASLYGNRVERFDGGDTEVLPWLYENGDRSRLYGIFFAGQFGYSLVWKRERYWGRPSYK